MRDATKLPVARRHRLNIRLSQQEWDTVHRLAYNTTCRSTSDYARKVLTEKPVKVFYRNKSYDEFEGTMTSLLPQLESFGDNFSLLVKKLSSLDSIPDIKASLPLVLACEKDFIRNMELIRDHIEKLVDNETQNKKPA